MITLPQVAQLIDARMDRYNMPESSTVHPTAIRHSAGRLPHQIATEDAPFARPMIAQPAESAELSPCDMAVLDAQLALLGLPDP